jgi:hypothetical protein
LIEQTDLAKGSHRSTMQWKEGSPIIEEIADYMDRWLEISTSQVTVETRNGI